jgi:hypothetical protein
MRGPLASSAAERYTIPREKNMGLASRLGSWSPLTLTAASSPVTGLSGCGVSWTDAAGWLCRHGRGPFAYTPHCARAMMADHRTGSSLAT